MDIIREDHSILKSLHEFNVPLEPYTETPLIIIPQVRLHSGDPKATPTKWDEFFEGTHLGGLDEIGVQDPHIFDEWHNEFTFMYSVGGGSSTNHGYVYGSCLRLADKILGFNFFQGVSALGVGVEFIKTFTVEAKFEDMPDDDYVTGDAWGTRIIQAAVLYNEPDELAIKSYLGASLAESGLTQTEAHMEDIMSYLRILISFHSYAYHGDQYLTLVESSKGTSKVEQRRRRKKPWILRNASRLIYLNKLPTETATSVSKGGHHASPVPHNKKGFWRTLRHKKYKNHPMYQVENGVYVRPCFVGDKESIVNNNRYTILTGRKYKKPIKDEEPEE